MWFTAIAFAILTPTTYGTETCAPTHCPLFSAQFVCLWNPAQSWCNAPDYEYPKPCVCERDGKCSAWNRIDRYQKKVWTEGLSGDERPEGPCSEIPCGECYVQEMVPCLLQYACRTVEGLQSGCRPDYPCGPWLEEEFQLLYYVETGAPCCADAF